MNGGELTGNTATSSGGAIAISNSTCTVTGGKLNGNIANNTGYGGGAVYVTSDSTFTASDTEMSGNVAYNGGAVYSAGGSVTMTGGSLTENTANSHGGGIYTTGKTTVTGTEISGNESVSYGGGIYTSGSTFTAKNVTITDNTSAGTHGGGVFVNSGTLSLENSTVTKNISAGNGAGIYVGGRLTAIGKTTVTGNAMTDETVSNVYLASGKLIDAAGVTADTSIGVSMAKSGTFTTGWTTSGLESYSVFTSDNEAYFVAKTDTDPVELMLKTEHHWSYSLSKDEKTITATCTDEKCTISDKSGGSITVVPPTDTVADGTIKEPSIINRGWIAGAIPDFEYEKVTAQKTRALKAMAAETETASVMPTEVGTYVAKLTIGEDDGAVTAKVQFTITNLTVTFDANGHGTETMPDDYENVAKGSTITAPKSPTESGYVFDGWYTEKACINAWTFDESTGKTGEEENSGNSGAADTVTDNMTLYAKWSLEQPSIAISDDYTGTYDAKSHAISVKPSHTLSNVTYSYQWYKDGEKIENATGDTYNVINVADSGSYTCRVTASDGTLAASKMSDAITVEITKATRSAPTDIKTTNESLEGKSDGTMSGVSSAMEYSHDGGNTWYSISGSSVSGLPAGGYLVRYAESANYKVSDSTPVTIGTGSGITVTFENNGHGTTPTAQTGLTYGDYVAQPTMSADAGHTFGGWYTDPDFSGSAWDFESDKVTKNTTLYAKWSLDAPTVTKGADYQETYDGESHELTVSATHPAEDVELTYQWYKRLYNGTYYANYIISGATESSYKVTDVADSGSYVCRVTASDGTLSSYTQTKVIRAIINKADQDPPTGLTATQESLLGNRDGMISGVDGTMEYKLSGSTYWTTVTTEPIANLAAGTYQVRYAETDNYNASPATEVTVKAGKPLTVTFDVGAHGTNPDDITNIAYGRRISAPTTPTATGYTFAGWYTNENRTVAWDFDTDTVKKDMTLYGKWTLNYPSVVVTTANADDDQITITLTPSHTAETAGVTITYSYRWMEDGEVVSGANDSTYTVDKDEFESTAYTCYVTASDGTLTSQVAVNVRDKSVAEGDKSETCTVTFEMNGHGTQIERLIGVLSGSKITEPTTPTSTGHTFRGWYKNSERTIAWDFEADKVTENMTLYARWSLNSPTVTVTKNETDGSHEFTVNPTNAASEIESITYTYRWTKNGTVIDGVTGGNYTITDDDYETSTYRCYVIATDKMGLTSQTVVNVKTVAESGGSVSGTSGVVTGGGTSGGGSGGSGGTNTGDGSGGSGGTNTEE
jgi:uncharacterized repeat protein (TIGR02543 family)